jgi:hypothetical protein
MIDRDGIRQRWQAVGGKLDERGQRLFAAAEVRSAGRGGLKAVSEITGPEHALAAHFASVVARWQRQRAALSEQIECDHRPSARLRRTSRLVQDVEAFLQCETLRLPARNDRACDIEFTVYRASNTHAVNCGGDSFCDDAADRTVHVLSPGVKQCPADGTGRGGYCGAL